MDIREKLGSMDPQEKSSLLNALKNTGNREEAERLLAEAGFEITAEDIDDYMKKTDAEQPELSDEDLSGIVGGQNYSINKMQDIDDVTFIASPGMTVEVDNTFLGVFDATVRCLVLDRRANYFTKTKVAHVGNHADSTTESFYADEYYVKPLEDHWYFSAGWVERDRIQMP